MTRRAYMKCGGQIVEQRKSAFFTVDDYRALPISKGANIAVACAIADGVTGDAFRTQLGVFDALRKLK